MMVYCRKAEKGTRCRKKLTHRTKFKHTNVNGKSLKIPCHDLPWLSRGNQKEINDHNLQEQSFTFPYS